MVKLKNAKKLNTYAVRPMFTIIGYTLFIVAMFFGLFAAVFITGFIAETLNLNLYWFNNPDTLFQNLLVGSYFIFVTAVGIASGVICLEMFGKLWKKIFGSLD